AALPGDLRHRIAEHIERRRQGEEATHARRCQPTLDRSAQPVRAALPRTTARGSLKFRSGRYTATLTRSRDRGPRRRNWRTSRPVSRILWFRRTGTGDHPSRTAVADGLERSTRELGRAALGRSLSDLAPGG